MSQENKKGEDFLCSLKSNWFQDSELLKLNSGFCQDLDNLTRSFLSENSTTWESVLQNNIQNLKIK